MIIKGPHGIKTGTRIWSANRETETGIGIITSAAVVDVVAVEDIMTRMRDMVPIAVIVVIIKGMGGQLTIGGDNLTTSIFIQFLTTQFFIVQCTYSHSLVDH
jgi:hypothetical protein